MSFWAATVITNFITAVPFVGDELVYRVWGGFSINNATLNRFFSLHHLLPFVVLLFAGIHLIMLHQSSSTNELRIRAHLATRVSFYPYFVIKDPLTLLYALLFFGAVVFYYPEIFKSLRQLCSCKFASYAKSYCTRVILFTVPCNSTIHPR